tara:strand:+ start:69 stop:677 length:609 start_codon:yes stop_codon:yes gene_type:complete
MLLKEIINQIPDKQYEGKSTTSRLFKQDLCDFFLEKKLNKVLEIGTCVGWTSLILSYIFNEVYTIEYNFENYQQSKINCKGRTNINFIHGDAYNDATYKNFPSYFDVVLIDCIHTYNSVISDINRALNYLDSNKGIYLIFDDYSHPEGTPSHEVRQAVDYSITQGLKLEKYIGQGKGYKINRNNGTSLTLIGPEGVVLSYGI